MEINDINREARNFVNNSTIKKTGIFLKKSNGDWSQFFSALDTIDDTCLAIDGFLQDSSDSFIKNPYLITYGLLQALFIQQDAVNHLKTSLFGDDKRIVWHTTYPELDKIRQLRNETTGHPVKKEQKPGKSKYNKDEISSCMIDRSSLSKDGFNYMLWMHSKTDTKSIKFVKIIKTQDNNLSVELKSILKELQKEEEQHKLKFKGDILTLLLSNASLYQINLVYGVHWNDHLAWPSFDYFHTQYKKIRNGLESRYGKFGSILRIPGTEEVIKKLDYVFSKLETFKVTGKYEQYEFEIHVDALETGLNELKTHLEQIDKEFVI